MARLPLKASGRSVTFIVQPSEKSEPMTAPVDTDYTQQPFLLVEDDSNDVYLMRSALPKAGLQNALHVVDNGDDAIAYLAGLGKFSDRERHPWPAVVLLDLNLPGKSGFDVLQWLMVQPFRAQIVVIVMTNSDRKSDADRARELKADLFVIKPAKFDALVELTRCLHYWLRLNREKAEDHSSRPPSEVRPREESPFYDVRTLPKFVYDGWQFSASRNSPRAYLSVY